MAFSKAKVKSLITKGKKIAGDLLYSGALVRTNNPRLLEDGTYQEATEQKFPCDILETGTSDTRMLTDVVKPTDKTVIVFGLGTFPLQGTDVLKYNGEEYICVLVYDKSVGTNQMHEIVVRKK